MTFKTFKNDKERKAFLEDYRNAANGWYLWTYDNALERRWWRLDMTEGISFIVEEDNLFFAYPKRHDEWTPQQWYITDQRIAQYACGDEKPHFGNYRASKSQAMEYLKKIEKGII
jgi:hypothetical protein